KTSFKMSMNNHSPSLNFTFRTYFDFTTTRSVLCSYVSTKKRFFPPPFQYYDWKHPTNPKQNSTFFANCSHHRRHKTNPDHENNRHAPRSTSLLLSMTA